MATLKQRKALAIMVENGGNVSRAMREAGYSPQTAVSPHKLTDSKGFREIADEVGLTDDFILRALQEDIEVKKQNRQPELSLAAKIKGMLKDKVDITSGDEPITIAWTCTSPSPTPQEDSPNRSTNAMQDSSLS